MGSWNTVAFFGSSFIISLILEIVGTNKGYVFGKYSYNKTLCPGPFVCNVPILISLSWSGLIYMSLSCSFLILGISSITIFNSIVYYSLNYTQVINGVLLISTIPVWIIVVSTILKVEKSNIYQIIGDS